MTPINLGTRIFKNRSLPESTQSLTNMYLETLQPDAKSPVIIHKVGGKRDYITVGSGPIRGTLELDRVLYCVSGAELYSITKSLVSTLIGTITGSGLVGMKINDRESGPQLVITNGTTTQHTYVAGGSLSTNTLTGPAFHVEYQDGYFIYDYSGTGKWFISSILDGTTFDSTETGASNARPDDVIRVISTHQQIWVFGSRSIEVFFNGDLGDFPFVRIPEAVNDELGLGARWSLVEMDNTIYWLGSDREIYRAVGNNAQQISDPSISERLRDIDLSAVTAFSYSDGGHKFYQINLDNESLVFDAKENVWHVKAYWNNGKYEKDRASTYVRFDDKHIVGDYQTGQLYTLDNTYHFDANTKPLRWEMITPPIHDNGTYLQIPNLFMDFESGVGLAGGVDPDILLEVSNDARVWRAGRQFGMGKIGCYNSRAIARRLGGSRNQMIFRISGSAPTRTNIIGLYYGSL